LRGPLARFKHRYFKRRWRYRKGEQFGNPSSHFFGNSGPRAKGSAGELAKLLNDAAIPRVARGRIEDVLGCIDARYWKDLR